MCLAPMSFRILACSALRTMLTRPMPSSLQILFSIWPRLEAAAVWTSALWPSRFIVSVMPSAVSGLTNHDAPSAAVVPAGSGWQSRAFRTRYCAYIEPPTIETVLPISACAASDEPAFTTVPAPSLPTGIDWSRRAARKGRAAGETLAFTTMLSPLPEVVAADMSAGPSSRPRSDGLIGVASTLTTTWSGPGSGIVDLRQRQFELAALGDQGTELQSRRHRLSPWFIAARRGRVVEKASIRRRSEIPSATKANKPARPSPARRGRSGCRRRR